MRGAGQSEKHARDGLAAIRWLLIVAVLTLLVVRVAGAIRAPERGATSPASGAPVVAEGAVARLPACGSRPAAAEGVRPRPPDTPAGEATEVVAPNALHSFNGYGTPEHLLIGDRAVVHYVTSGVNAPPLNDDDADGIPDYVEDAGAAASRSLSYFASRGFRAVRPDAGGPNVLPDIYISRFTPGYFGIALPANHAEGGAFVAVANTLDRSDSRCLASLPGTIAHELFHLVQFSYFRASSDPPLPDWVLEGMAGGVEGRVFPDLDDVITRAQTQVWLSKPSQSLTRAPYAAELFWLYADRADPRLLPIFLGEFARAPSGSATTALSAACRRARSGSLAALFHRFAVGVYADEPDRLRATAGMGVGTRRVSVLPLSVAYVHLQRPAGFGYRIVATTDGDGSIRTGVSVTFRVPAATAGGWPVTVAPPAVHSTAKSISWVIHPSAQQRAVRDLTVVLTATGSSGASSYVLRTEPVEPPR